MSGQELYALYTKASEANGTGVDSWYDLSSDEWDIWETFAKELAPRLKPEF